MRLDDQLREGRAVTWRARWWRLDESRCSVNPVTLKRDDQRAAVTSEAGTLLGTVDLVEACYCLVMNEPVLVQEAVA